MLLLDGGGVSALRLHPLDIRNIRPGKGSVLSFLWCIFVTLFVAVFLIAVARKVLCDLPLTIEQTTTLKAILNPLL